MSGHAYGQHEPTEPCPYCGTRCRADFCDIGIGFQQVGPFHCEQCGASEIGPFDEERERSADEIRTGWYEPGTEPGSSANVIGGKVVSHVQMRDTYRDEFVGNPLWHDQSYVDEWWRNVRKP